MCLWVYWGKWTKERLRREKDIWQVAKYIMNICRNIGPYSQFTLLLAHTIRLGKKVFATSVYQIQD